jgi:hypothetical protein
MKLNLMNDFQTNKPAMTTSLQSGGHKDSSAVDVHIPHTGRVLEICISADDVNINIHSPLAPCFTAVKNLYGAGLKQCGGLPHENPVLIPSVYKICWAWEAIVPPGFGFRSSEDVLYAQNEKNCLA